jgi:hypothetical protein
MKAGTLAVAEEWKAAATTATPSAAQEAVVMVATDPKPLKEQ